MFALTGTGVVPSPIICFGVLLPYFFVVPHSKWTVVARPFGSMVPLSVAPTGETFVAGLVVALGGPAASAGTANESSIATARTDRRMSLPLESVAPLTRAD